MLLLAYCWAWWKFYLSLLVSFVTLLMCSLLVESHRAAKKRRAKELAKARKKEKESMDLTVILLNSFIA